ncbi:DNA cytosine methyltransferase [Lactobacillus apis]|uniref:DNA cytosine methyltransferase n=1 Tax=Lactobacillus apis TaxID=303541 RepID=UPI0027412C1D|nr:DNA cytosine methyltransferase [Lactobacillus apis]WLS84951.1 DNA cytosine methyltransferase [Lactobacillus apis]
MKKFNVVDLFAGAGGMSVGFQEAGFNILGAVEQDLWASETLKYNFPNCKVINCDIQTLTDTDINNYFSPKKVDVVIGGPPCQGFSIANRNAGDPKDPRNSLFRYFINAIKVLKPKVFVMENVPNLLNAKTEEGFLVIDIIKNEIDKLGYSAYIKLLNAQDYGVPQNRKRLIIIGSKKEINEPFPKPTFGLKNDLFSYDLKPYRTVWEAISDLPDIEAREGGEVLNYTKLPENEYQEFVRLGSKFVYNHKAMNHSKRIVERFKNMPVRATIEDIPISLRPRKRGTSEISEKYYSQNNRRMKPDEPCNTITASFYANFIHPFKNRNFTAREGARIQSFPDRYRFMGKPTVVSNKLLKKEGRDLERHLSQYNQIGNAVPPLLAKAIADQLIKQMG